LPFERIESDKVSLRSDGVTTIYLIETGAGGICGNQIVRYAAHTRIDVKRFDTAVRSKDMSYLSNEQLVLVGFKSIGKCVLVSDRAAIYNPDQIELGDNSRIDDFCVVSGKIKFGRNVHIAVFCSISGGIEGVEIDDFAGISYGSHVFSQSDDYTGTTLTGPTVPAIYNNVTRKAVYIGRHCIVGAGSVIFPGVRLGDGCAVGAMSMVTKSTDAWSVYFGIPAKKRGERSQELLIMEKKYLNIHCDVDGGSKRRNLGL
jgi:galactoside O-acetyltransferase